MSYTVGIKRRFLPGYKQFRVRQHEWQNFRFILDLEDGAQIHIPGFQSKGLKVYPDFWTYLQTQRDKIPPKPQQQPREAPVYREAVQPQQTEEDNPVARETFPSDLERRAHQLAAERVQRILSSNSETAAGGPRPFPS